jgi:hypothetical protein
MFNLKYIFFWFFHTGTQTWNNTVSAVITTHRKVFQSNRKQSGYWTLRSLSSFDKETKSSHQKRSDVKHRSSSTSITRSLNKKRSQQRSQACLLTHTDKNHVSRKREGKKWWERSGRRRRGECEKMSECG